jgi:hypothetical protein
MTGVVLTPDVVAPIAKKLAEIMRAIVKVPKRGRNEHFGYAYARDEDVVASTRNEFAKRNLIIVPAVDEVAHDIRPDGERKVRILTTARMTMTILDGDSGFSIAVPWAGTGEDAGDKSLYKALTGAEKYFLLKLLQLATGDDPEASRGPRPSGPTAVVREKKPTKPEAVDPKTGEIVDGLTMPQRKLLWARASKAGWTRETLKEWLFDTLDLDSTSKIRSAQLDAILERIDLGPKGAKP